MTTDNVYINPTVTIENKTTTTSIGTGQSGKVAVIGAFPSADTDVHTFKSLRSLRNFYGIQGGTDSETKFNGALASKWLFMDGINGSAGAEQVTVVNIAVKTKTGTPAPVEGEGDDTYIEVDSDPTDYDLKLTNTKLLNALSKLANETINLLYIASDLEDAKVAQVLGDDGKTVVTPAVTIDDIYKKLLDFSSTKTSVQRPCHLVVYMNCTDNIAGGQDQAGIGSTLVNVNEAVRRANIFADYPDPYVIGGLIVHGHYLLGKKVTPMEYGAYYTGFLASLPVDQSTTQLDLPGTTGLSEELYFGSHDAGSILNSAGIVVVAPKDRLNNRYCINNGMQPCKWDIAHIRSVAYLLQSYTLYGVLGLNNTDAQIEAFKSSLTTTNNQVKQELSIIKDVTNEDIEVVDPYHIYVPLTVTLYGVIESITVGVKMELGNSNT